MNSLHQTAVFGLLALVLALDVVPEPPVPQPAVSGKVEEARQGAEGRDARREEMRREVEEAGHAIAAYSKAESDQALNRARAALDAMDKRIDDARLDGEREAARMSAGARERPEHAMAELHAQRIEAAERYRALQGASSATWERVKEEFLASYRSLADKLRLLANADSADGASSPGQEPEPSAEKKESSKKDN